MMPWHVAKSSKCPASKPWACIKDADGSVVGCHPTKAKAEAQMAALYANEPGAKMSADADCGCEQLDEQAHQETRAVDHSAWDGGAAMSHCANSSTPASCYGSICAGRKSGDPALQSSWALPHHKTPGSPPNADGVRNALSRLSQTQGLTNKAAAQKHLDAHMSSIHAQSNDAVPQEVRQIRAALHREQPAAVPAGAARYVSFPSQLRAERIQLDGKDYVHIHGVASAYEQPYEMWDIAGPYNEIVSEAAGATSLANNPDVAFLVNHKGVIMARTVNERRPMELAERSDGLHVDAWVNPTRQDVRDVVTAIDDGDITEMSFAFMIADGKWNDDFTEYRINAYDIDRGDVSVVNYGANPYTSVAARSREILADLDRLPAGAARAALERLSHRPDLGRPVTPADQTGGRDLVKAGRSVALVQHMLLAEQL